MLLHDHRTVVIAKTARVIDGDDRLSYPVTKRGTTDVIGYVTNHKTYAWAYRLADVTVWTLAGTTRADAVDQLMSAWSPSAAWLI